MKFKTLLLIPFITLLCSCSPKIPNEVTFEVDEISSEVIINTDKQREMIDCNSVIDYINQNGSKMGNEEISYPLGAKLSWKAISDTKMKATRYEISYSEEQSMASSLSVSSKKNEVEVDNLKINKTYYYQIKAYYREKAFLSDVSSFTVKDYGIRTLRVPGVINVRDLGDDHHIKQGLIYRSGQFNYDTDEYNPIKSKPTDEGLCVLKDTLKIKTDIDLRKTVESFDDDEVVGITSSPLGSDVNYVSVPMIYGNKNIFTQEDNKASIKTFFETLGNINNYPVIFHCVRGTDRTGALAYVLKALCGFERENLYLDYYFSNYSNISSPVTYLPFSGSAFYDNQINNFEGETLKEKTMNYLVDNIGLTSTQINAVINIISASE